MFERVLLLTEQLPESTTKVTAPPDEPPEVVRVSVALKVPEVEVITSALWVARLNVKVTFELVATR